MLETAVAIYTDGGLLSPNPSNIGCTWAWVAVDAENRKVGYKSGTVLAPDGRTLSNNHSEQMAIVRAIEALPFGWSGTIYTDSQVAMQRVESDYEQYTLGRKRYPAGEENLYKSISVRSKKAVVKLGVVNFVLVEGHPSKVHLARGFGKKGLPVSEWNKWCDTRCNLEKKMYRQSLIERMEALVNDPEHPIPLEMVLGKAHKALAIKSREAVYA